MRSLSWGNSLTTRCGRMRCTFLFKSGAKLTLLVSDNTIKSMYKEWKGYVLANTKDDSNQFIIELTEVVAVWQEESDDE